MTPETLVEAVSHTFGRVGSAWYFLPETLAAGREVGLDGLRFYFLGRGGTLGDVHWRVVFSAFGYFEPSMVEKMWTSGRERCAVKDAVAAHLGACRAFGRETLAGVDDLATWCAAAERVVEAAICDAGGLTLFAGYAAQPLPDDPPARASQLVAVLRELRGSAHLTAVVASGLPTPIAHEIRRPADVAYFGWAEGALPEPTDDDRRRLAQADVATDAILARIYSTLTPPEADALLAGTRAVAAAMPA